MISKQQARKIRAQIESLSASLPDDQALEVPEMFPIWEPSGYSKDDRVRYGGVLYKCLQSHDANETWTPADAPSLWAQVLIPDPTDIPEWIQPDSTNPYMTGDKVTHNGQTWQSIIDNNVWEPGVYGWEVVG